RRIASGPLRRGRRALPRARSDEALASPSARRGLGLSRIVGGGICALLRFDLLVLRRDLAGRSGIDGDVARSQEAPCHTVQRRTLRLIAEGLQQVVAVEDLWQAVEDGVDVVP